MATTDVGQWLVWMTVVGSIAAWMAVVVDLWRTRAGGELPERQVRYLLEELIKDFDELAAGAGRHEWFIDPVRRDRELRLAALNAALSDDGLELQVLICRAAYLDCWTMASAGLPVAADGHLSEATRRGSVAAASALARIKAV